MTDYGPSNNNDQSRFLPFQDNARPYLERSRAPFDLTHAFKANFTYELPIGRGHRLLGSPGRALGLLVNGWQTGSIFILQSGAPFSIVSQYATFNRGGFRSVANTAVATLTHQQISGDLGTFKTADGVVYLINPKLISSDGTGAPSSPQLGGCTPAVTGGFCNPQPGEVGNLQQYAFNAPAYFVWNMTASKDFDITRTSEAELPDGCIQPDKPSSVCGAAGSADRNRQFQHQRPDVRAEHADDFCAARFADAIDADVLGIHESKNGNRIGRAL